MSFATYDFLRALHLILVIAWMAGLLMLPRFLAYQTGAIPGGELDQKMTQAVRSLRTIILTPAMVGTWIFGLIMLFQAELWRAGWMHGKLLLVFGLTGLHGFFVAESKRMAAGARPRSEKFWRRINEVPFVIAIVVVLLAVYADTQFGR